MNGAADVTALELERIEKRFGASVALDRADLILRAGTVHALLGENGAGKTTLMRIAYGMLIPDAGSVRVRGQTVALRSPADAIALGIGMVHQHFTHVAAMTVAENVALGGHGRFDRATAERRVCELGEETGLVLDPSRRAADLGVGAQQRLEIVKALARDASVLVLDEPTAVLAPAEADDLLSWLRAFASRGRSVVLITHKLREALAVADEVTVLRRGRSVLATHARDVSTHDLAAAMLGDAPPAPSSVPLPNPGPIVARLEQVTIRDDRDLAVIADATLEVRAGEILGIAGVENSGHHALLRTIAGRGRDAGGRVERRGNSAFVPEDRQRDALVMSFSLYENVALKDAGRRRGRMRWSEWRETAKALVREYDVRPADVELSARSLSGGNQQKLVLARELSREPTIVVAENPTRGLDIRAAAAVQTRLREAASRGLAVVLYSSDLDEILAIATRVLVVHAGRIRSVPLERERVGRAMLGLD